MTTDEAILEMLKEGFLTNAAISSKLGLHRSATLRQLHTLEEKQIVERVTKGNVVFWKLAHASEPARETVEPLDDLPDEPADDTLSLIDELRALELRKREILEALR